MDPGDKWEIQDVFKHLGKALELMFECFKVKQEEQNYQPDVGKKTKETFQIKLEIKKSDNIKYVIDNFKSVKFQCQENSLNFSHFP